MAPQDSVPEGEALAIETEIGESSLISGLCRDISIRADIRFTEAMIEGDANSEETLFVTNRFNGIEVDQLRIRIDDKDLQPQRGEVDLMAGYNEIIVRQPTDMARVMSPHELPPLLITLIPKQEREEDLPEEAHGQASVTRKQVTLAVWSDAAREVSFDPVLIRQAGFVEPEVIKTQLTEADMERLVEAMRSEHGFDFQDDSVEPETRESLDEYEIEDSEILQGEILSADGEALMEALNAVYGEEEVMERFVAEPWCVELDTNVKPLLAMVRQYLRSGKLATQVDHSKEIGHPETETE